MLCDGDCLFRDIYGHRRFVVLVMAIREACQNFWLILHRGFCLPQKFQSSDKVARSGHKVPGDALGGSAAGKRKDPQIGALVLFGYLRDPRSVSFRQRGVARHQAKST